VRTESLVNQTFLANMTSLWRHDPRLAQQIDEFPLDAGLDVQPSKAGPPTACVTMRDGRKLYLHSRYDPQREAAEFCKTLDISEAHCVVLCGLGLGYHLSALVEMLGDEVVIFVAEPDLVTIKTALEHTDLARELAGGRIDFLTTLEKATLHEQLQRHSTMLMLGTVFAAPPVSRELHGEFHATCRQAVTDFAAFWRMSLVTLVRNAGITCRNIANNLPTYVSTPPLDELRGRFQGVPAILVAAGPSLAKNIDQLVALQDRAVIIAAQTTLRLLLERGIKPHFVTTLDFSDMSRQFFEGFDIPEEVVLVAEPKASWHVVDAFLGSNTSRRVIMLDNEFAHRCLGESLAKRAALPAGATVMHLAFYLAQWLGCDPIVFVGQDLGFTGHVYYTPGVAMHRAWTPELGRFGSLEMKEWQRIARHREILRRVKTAGGDELYTDEQMFTYLEQFERDFARSRQRIIDATEGGAAKRGAEVMTLSDAASQFCSRQLDSSLFGGLSTPWRDRSRLGPARQVLAAHQKELVEFRALCEQTKRVLEELESLLDDPRQFDRRIMKIDELRTLVQGHELIFQMVRDVSQLGELQKFAADRRMVQDEHRSREGGEAKEPSPTQRRKRAQRQLQRDGQLVASLLEGCETLGSILADSLARFDQAMERDK
jgi:hypothetical protein